ncbi:MAG TPA: DNA repair protein RecN [Candidatus Binataceae bacterium]|jgi:DNA repair protein RecN (Recombination protein N)|nr:DNA repair protein RecN [Candidatus Binataceae bacterium]
MLLELRIRNFAIIDQVALEFGPGLNVLSGETGAGKTIIMNALGLLLGMRASPEMVRADQKEAVVEGLFEVEGEGLAPELLAGLERPAPRELIVKRVVSEAGRSRVLINDEMATVQTLARIGAALVEVYGQHEQQSLLRTENHLTIVDRFAALEADLAAYRGAFGRARECSARLAGLEQRARDRERRLEAAQFELGELERAQLDADDERELAAQRAILANAARLIGAVGAAEQLLMDQDGAAADLMGRAQAALGEAAGLDPKLAEPLELIGSARVGLEEAVHSLRLYRERIEADPGRLEQIDNRMAEIARLKRKYGGSVETALATLERLRAEVAELEHVEESIAGLKAEAARELAQAASIARQLSQARKGAGARLKQKMQAELKTLGMRNAVFEARLTPFNGDSGLECEGLRMGADGIDECEFQIAPNLGQPPMALVKIASGGELSRVMLALKRLEAQRRGVATMIFDEVDAGIGGAVADVVGRKLKELSRFHQILCITHLPQIASFANRHFRVEKEERRGTTTSKVTELDRPQRVEELARMLGGAEVSDRFRRAARELLQRAQ